MKIEIKSGTPEGYDRIAEYRAVHHGEEYLNGFGAITSWYDAYPSVIKYIVLKKLWQPAPWMPKGAFLRYYDGIWIFQRRKRNGCYGRGVPAEFLAEIYGETFVPPTNMSQILIIK